MNMSVVILVITNLVTLAAGIAIGFYLATITFNLEYRRKENTQVKDKKPRRRFGRFGRIDIILAVLLTGNIISAATAINSNSQSANAEATGLRTVQCLENFANGLSEALDRRNRDNAKLQDVDAARDAVVVQLLMTTVNSPDDTAAIAALSRRLAEATVAKQQATDQVSQGRAEKSYPEAPKEACPHVVE